VVDEVIYELSAKLEKLRRLGIADLIIDPGFGFAKTPKHNFAMLSRLDEFSALGCPLLVGVSRKSMVWKTLGTDADGALNGTSVLNTIALLKGAAILRVHDVRECREAITLVDKTKSASHELKRI
jgi:dihydropteroate synthase